MQDKMELWKQLCAKAAVEQDPKRLAELVQQINKLLDEKRQRLSGPQRITTNNSN
jgi:hypothetical protein